MDITNGFWSFINFVCNMPYELLCKPETGRVFGPISSCTSAFKLHRNIIDASALRAPLPEGVRESGEWIVFKDIDSLFLGMCNMYTHAAESEKRSRLFFAARVLQDMAAARATPAASASVSDDGGLTALEHMIETLHF